MVALLLAMLPPGLVAAQAGACFTSPGPAELSVGNNPYSVAIGDFNGDSKLDIVAANFGSNSVSIRLGDGSGHFSSPSPAEIGVGTNPKSVAVGDFNGDSKLDVVVANSGSGTVSIRLGDGNGHFTSPTPAQISVGSSPNAVAVGDFNGDGKLDFATANGLDNNVSIRLGDGGGHFTSPSPAQVSVDIAAYSVATGDVNKDGKLDLMVANYGSDTVSILLGDGNGHFSSPSPREIVVGSHPLSVAAGDFNNDGRLDIVTTNTRDFNRGADDVSIRLGDGAGHFSSPSPPEIGVGSTPYAVMSGDFNGDGYLDLAVANSGSGTVSIRLGDGNGHFMTPSPGEIGVGTTPRSVAVGDFDRDGRLDIASANYGDGTVSIRLNCHENAPPVVTTPSAQIVAEDTALTFATATSNALSIADPDIGSSPARATLTAGHGTLTLSGTAGLSFTLGDGTADSTMTFTGTLSSINTALNGLTYAPAANFTGTDQLSVTVDDQGQGDQDGPRVAGGAVAITVTAVNDPPAAANDSYPATSGATLTIAAPGLLANDTDVDSPTLTALKITDPAHGSLALNPNGGFTYIPTAGFTGTDSFTYKASDGSTQSNVATVTITVSVGPGNVGSGLLVANDMYSVIAQSTLTVAAPGLLANDANAVPSSLTAVKVADPLHGSLTLNANGSFSYTPKTDFFGTDSFTYRASDGTSSSSIATVTVTVTPTQCGPRPKVQTFPVAGGGKLQVHVETTLNTQQSNPFTSIRFGTLQNAKVTLNGQPISSGQTFMPPANVQVVDFTVERAQPNQATTVPFTVVDGCGEWPTFVGGGTGAGF